MTKAEAEKVLKKHKFTPGDSTKPLKGDVRKEVKAALYELNRLARHAPRTPAAS